MSDRPLRVLIATPEVAPYYQAGGLGEAVRGLADALARIGHEVRIITPAYHAGGPSGAPAERRARRRLGKRAGRPPDQALIPWPGGPVLARFSTRDDAGAAHTVFVHQDAFLRTPRPYDAPGDDDGTLARRFAFFARAVVAFANAWNADVVHANDWTTGLVPVYGLLDSLRAATIFAIHNLGYQGNFSPDVLPHIGVPADLFRIENGVEFHGHASFMKAGIALADRLVTVSPTYALEVQTPEHGHGFDGLLRFRRRVLHGILNGIDTSTWDPARDPIISRNYTARRLDEKDVNRAALLDRLGLEDGGPLFVTIGRLVHQKGPDLLLAALPGLVDAGARVAVLGTGEIRFERAFATAAARAPGRVHASIGFDEGLARRMYAGGDFLLMPSRYEPCGLAQLIAQRYGTPPVARRTGGLADTIVHRKTGFLFDDATPDALIAAARDAARVWRARGWDTLRRRCMRLDRAWDAAARQYADVYRTAIGPR